MAKLIKSFRSNGANILEYVRHPLEEIDGTGALNGHRIDPMTILADARAEAEIKVKEAYAEGLKRGEEAGLAAFQESVGDAAAMLDEVATSLQEHRTKYIDEIESQVSELVRIVASKVLAIEVTTQPEVIQLMVCRTLEKMIDQEQVTIRVNPNDYAQVVESKKSLLERFERIQQLELIQDDTIESGGCIAESDRLYVDAQLQAQLNQVIDGMNEVQD